MTETKNFVEEKMEDIRLSEVTLDNEKYLKISNYANIRPFFMSIVSDSDHWMFISSNGGLSAGRKNAEYALFPYYTDDKISEFSDITGSKTILQIELNEERMVWEPFSDRFLDKYSIQRNIYKSIFGNSIIFEEVNQNLQLSFRYGWYFSDIYGFVKKSAITNLGDSKVDFTLLDGIQNIMPYGVSSDLQRASSNLVDAYKRNEIHPSSGLGIFALSAIIVDKAEPSEALKANVAWSIGLDKPLHLLSSLQLNAFRSGNALVAESDVKGEKGAYFVSAQMILKAGESHHWKIIANVNQSQSETINLIHQITKDTQLETKIESDIIAGKKALIALVTSSDGMQCTADQLQDYRHYSNVLFNIMRGGIFDQHYQIEKQDFVKYLTAANKDLIKSQVDFVTSLDELFSYRDLIKMADASDNTDLIRLATEYLPLKFSRRHGDPSRPWNKFNINLKDERDGSKILDYEGNWRDIFQNWEALAWSYPDFIEGMIFKFLNASTFDGYNPYRVTKDGFDWEVIEPDDPWSYIGYWGDHQIIYLQKFLEIIDKFKPGQLQNYFEKDCFVYAAVPYIIKSYEEIVKNPKDTIEFDHHWDQKIRQLRDELGADGALLRETNDNDIYRVNFIEKILATLLAKMSNFIPDGGIWMNTQRPEWNDANNALVGNGVSMVTLYYLRRFLKFMESAIEKSKVEQYKISSELIEFYHSVRETLQQHHSALTSGISDKDKKKMLDRLGAAASDYRHHVYKNGFWGKKRSISREGLSRFIRLSLDFIEQTIKNNRRDDNLYHAYNLMSYNEDGVTISYLDEMLEGQVAVLSSGYLSGAEALAVLDGMKISELFRPDQYSYILYPNKQLPGFLQKNKVDAEYVQGSKLIQRLLADGKSSIIEKDVNGDYHFNGSFRNANDLKTALLQLKDNGYEMLVEKDQAYLLSIFEKVFNHKAFTGRSGTFYSYEGLGSIYWHMVSKLLLAVQECCLAAINNAEEDKIIGGLLDHYYEIQAGIGVHKSPALYGAFPTDPYSHTPMHRGAQQPGMTGQVKEDILVKWSELGVNVNNGKIGFDPCLLLKSEFLTEAVQLNFNDINGQQIEINLDKGQLFFSFCQVPVIYTCSDKFEINVVWDDDDFIVIPGNCLDTDISEMIFHRTGAVKKLVVSIDQKVLK